MIPIRLKRRPINWGATGIGAPHIFLPLAIGVGSAPTTAANYGNIGPASFTLNDSDNSCDAAQGVYTGGANDGVFSGVAADDAAGSPLYDMLNIFDSSVAAKRLLIDLWVAPTDSTHRLLSFGSTIGTDGHTWSINWNPSPNTYGIALVTFDSGGTPTNVMTAPNGELAILTGATEQHFSVLLDFVSRDVSVAVNGTLANATDEATILAARRDLSAFRAGLGLTLFGSCEADPPVPGSRTMGSSALVGTARNVLIMNLTNASSVSHAAIVAARRAAPQYTLPSYFERF
jgi:hypothetical protein